MKIIKNRFFIGTLCIIAALVFSFIVMPALSGSQNTVSVVRMATAVTTGTQIIEDMLEIVSIPEGIIDGGFTDVSSAAGKYASANLYIGDYLTSSKLTDTFEEADSFSAGTVKEKLVVSVTLPSLASGVSGRLLPGDIVTVMVVPESKTAETLGIEPADSADGTTGATEVSTIIYPELQHVEVCLVTTGDGTDASVEAELDDGEKNSLPVTVSFYVSQKQALRIAELEKQGTIYLAFVARGDDAARYISDVDRVLNAEVE